MKLQSYIRLLLFPKGGNLLPSDAIGRAVKLNISRNFLCDLRVVFLFGFRAVIFHRSAPQTAPSSLLIFLRTGVLRNSVTS